MTVKHAVLDDELKLLKQVKFRISYVYLNSSNRCTHLAAFVVRNDGYASQYQKKSLTTHIDDHASKAFLESFRKYQ